jgi:hypothetical protein
MNKTLTAAGWASAFVVAIVAIIAYVGTLLWFLIHDHPVVGIVMVVNAIWFAAFAVVRSEV